MARGKGAGLRHLKRKKQEYMQRGESDDGHSDHETSEEIFREKLQKQFNIPDKVMNFMDRNKDVAQALQGLAKYDIESVVENWDEEFMSLVMGNKKRADFVLEKLKKWLHSEGVYRLQVTSTINPYFVSLD